MKFMFAKLDSRMKILILYVLKNKAKVQAKCDSTFDCSVESYSEQAPCPQPENAGCRVDVEKDAIKAMNIGKDYVLNCVDSKTSFGFLRGKRDSWK
ncbi:hypothetical protein V6N13_122105 [Hibiscus sabdariffa]